MIQDPQPPFRIVYRPRFMKPGGWFAWVARDKKPGWKGRLEWTPLTQRQAMKWYRRNWRFI